MGVLMICLENTRKTEELDIKKKNQNCACFVVVEQM